MFLQVIICFTLLNTVEMYRDYSSPYNNPCGYSATQVHDGDIAYYLTKKSDHRTKRGATSDHGLLWPGGRIPFKISPAFYYSEQENIYEAMRVWENSTCIRFYERPEDHNESYVYFMRGGCCASYVGRQSPDLQQGISLGYGCNKFSTYLHEIGHAIGFWHEQSRPDRDWYIRVLMENVIPISRNNFRTVEQINSLGIGYDYNSIMHYSSTAFSHNGRPTIEAHDPSIPLGGAVDLSELDILQTNLLYQCDMNDPPPSMLPPPPTPPNDTKPPLPPYGQEFTEYEGNFSSPGYPDTYPPNNISVYRISLPEGSRLMIVITGFLMDWTPMPCTRDSLTIYTSIDGSGHPLWSRCGASYNNVTLLIEEGVAYIEFRSDGDNEYENMKGFEIYYKGEDINECQTDNGGCSQACVNLVPGYQCLCDKGWFLSADDHTCFDMNECAVGNGGCEHWCNNTGGSFYCSCVNGSTLHPNGKACISPETSCNTDNSECDHICHQTSSGAVCSCETGFRLDWDGFTCIDIDECRENNACGYGGCRNTAGSYTCTCQRGYEMDNDTSQCINVDECLRNIHLCGGGSQCQDTDGAYECVCGEGFKSQLDRLLWTCIDIDECAEEVCSHIEGAICQNTPGSHECICSPGYEISRSVCKDIDECTLHSEVCSHIEGAICHNTPGSHNCICSPGFILSGNTCKDINECSKGVHNCEHGCLNTNGSYICTCPSGYMLGPDGQSCQCGGILDGEMGTFSTPGWPYSYPMEDFVCTWIINNTTPNTTIHFMINESAYGINGRQPCLWDYIQFFDGIHEDAETMFKLCKFDIPSQPMITSSSQAKVAFKGSRILNRPRSRVGVQVIYRILKTVTFPPVNECLDDNGGCDHICTDMPSSFNCSCRPGYSLNDDGRTCRIDCGGQLSGASGSFQTPDWPERYPQADFTCVWTIPCPPSPQMIHFTVDTDDFGINGRPPSCIDHLRFFRGPGRTSAVGNKICFLRPPTAPIEISSCSEATVVFTGHLNMARPTSRVGVKVKYEII